MLDYQPLLGSSEPGGCCNSSASIPARDRLLMSPWDKWNVHGRFPFKFLLQSLIFVLSVSQVGGLLSRYSTLFHSDSLCVGHAPGH